MTSAEPLGAEGGGARSRVYTGSDDEDGEEGSSILADLAAMFPNIAYDELVTILRSHGGDIDATVDYLMALSLHKEGGGASLTSSSVLNEEGQFSSEIGGLPEVLPSFMTQTDSDSDEEDVPVNQARKDVNSDEDPLPTYDEAMDDGEGYRVAGSILLPVATKQRSLIEGQPPGMGPSKIGNHLTQKKKKKRKKLKKLAGKLNIKKNKSADDKTEQDREALETSRHLHPLLQPLVKSDELELERVTT